ncbi:PD40 domain-containing protein [Streptomyces sp. ISL-11]|uniref:TolB family protein n=1 Tax=Streptomyces sp. ISL-11 TaxID=2819174 RepID=UPI001BE8FD57|nr:PD40 domain-containing protein [Streptomyces sp. ISL-11]MBT2387678.1 PD40 domain-containing protein [Streptomyces sp. ISL-11]
MRSRPLLPAAFLAALSLTALVLTGCGGEPGPPAPTDDRAIRADGAQLLYRGRGGGSAQNPAFSPDGGSVLFTLFQDGYNKGAAALRVLSLAKGAAARPGTLLEETDRAAVNLPGTSWHPSAGVTFASDRAGRDEVWVLPPGGKQPVRVTEHRGDSGYLEPSFSPDGRWIVFQESLEEESADDGDRPSRSALGSLWKVRRDGREATRLLDGPGTRTDNRQPNWSPKGGRLVFQRRAHDSDDWALYVMNADGTGLRRLTDVPGEHTDPSWSPDGRSVVFSSTAGGLDVPQIFVIPADGGGRPVRVTRSTGGYDGAPSWSPDGRWIAFEAHTGDEDRPTSLWRVPAPRQP